jgi:hypothetical protein
VGTSLGRDAFHPSIFNTDLLVEQRQLLPESIGFLFQSDACVPTVGGPASGVSQGEVSQGDGLEDAGANALWPALGQGNPFIREHGTADENPGTDVPEVG